jgi:chloramphenicol-sensitive protein RarD
LTAPALLSAAERRAERHGVLLALACYLFWGFFPLYFKLLAHIPALEVLCHRIVWSLACLLPLALLGHRRAALSDACRDRATLLRLGVTTLLIALNWLLFLHAVASDQVLESSLGYFINPLVSALLGGLFLGERLSRAQYLALLLACAGVAHRTWQLGHLPWIALTLAVTFGLYGLLRKEARADALTGLTIETALLAPLALAYLVVLGVGGHGAFLAGTPRDNLLLPLAGAITALPLVTFTAAARRLRLTTIGFLQYLTPTLHFVCAVVFFQEPFDAQQLASFALIWGGLLLYSLDALRQLRRPLPA